jgi:hypothetical protein
VGVTIDGKRMFIHEIINTGEPQSALNYPDQLIENLLDRDDHIICVLLIKQCKGMSIKLCVDYLMVIILFVPN